MAAIPLSSIRRSALAIARQVRRAPGRAAHEATPWISTYFLDASEARGRWHKVAVAARIQIQPETGTSSLPVIGQTGSDVAAAWLV